MNALFSCPLCGHSFDPAAHLACQTCPLHSGCHLVCCPRCGHTSVDQGQSRLVRWVASLLERSAAQRESPRAAPQAAAACALADLPLASRARVADLSRLPAAQREQLRGYGVLPGCVLRVTQQTPATVVQIEHTELAIEPEIARAIRVDQLA
jgi:Fe2+ transport system protein FeoA